MFRASDPQRSLFNAYDMLTERQQKRMKSTFAYAFRQHALPLIDERAFADLYHDRLGAPNKPVRMMLGVLILKDLSDLTDEEALDALMFDTRWHVALDLEPSEAHLCQKSLHNFRVALMQSDKGPALFEHTTSQLLDALNLSTDRQRLDSTHICSHVARLTRLGTCCETIRLLLKHLKRRHAEAFGQVPEALRDRYFKPDGSASKYDDATREQARRRLPVAARDVYRLWDRFRTNDEIAASEPFGLLVRCLHEQCELVAEPQVPGETDRDAGEEAVPIKPRDKKNLPGTTLATPHDPDATFGAKGLGYEVQLAETFGNKAADAEAGVPVRPELITYVELTASWAPDVHETMPAIEDLARRGIQPLELEVDANFTGSEVVLEAQRQGTEVNGPVKGGEKKLPKEDDVTLAEFTVVPDDPAASRCPQGHAPREQTFDPETGKLTMVFDEEHCRECPLKDLCPSKPMKGRRGPHPAGSRQVRTTPEELCTHRRRRYQLTQEFYDRQANRAGIEATNSELKRRHGLGRLRVRHLLRVKLAVILKVVTCNIKRYLGYQQALALQ